MPSSVVLELPEPPVLSNARGHWYVRARRIREYKAQAWFAAIQQVRPAPDPPRRVRVDAHFRLWNLRDVDNLVGSAKYVLDALKQNIRMQHLGFRDGILDQRGFFWDDDPAHLELGTVTQEIDRKHRGLTLTIVPLGEDG